jgi:hypothetical protein
MFTTTLRLHSLDYHIYVFVLYQWDVSKLSINSKLNKSIACGGLHTSIIIYNQNFSSLWITWNSTRVILSDISSFIGIIETLQSPTSFWFLYGLENKWV